MGKYAIDDHFERPGTHDAEHSLQHYPEEGDQNLFPVGTKKMQEVMKAFVDTQKFGLTQHLPASCYFRNPRCEPGRHLLPRFEPCALGFRRPKIGRASCRERV